jgi:hypothetical protein
LTISARVSPVSTAAQGLGTLVVRQLAFPAELHLLRQGALAERARTPLCVTAKIALMSQMVG